MSVKVIVIRMGEQYVAVPEGMVERLRDGLTELLEGRQTSVNIGSVEVKVLNMATGQCVIAARVMDPEGEWPTLWSGPRKTAGSI